jgi:S1-C subfamily serine protease
MGTGFFITEDGYLITNHHVVTGTTSVSLKVGDSTIPAKIVSIDASSDLALLKAEGSFTALPVSSSRGVSLGESVATVGFPDIELQGLAPKYTRGEINSLSGPRDDPNYFQISVPVQPGNSGGALVDQRGNVIGVVSAKLSARTALFFTQQLPENVNYAIKGSLLLAFLESQPDVVAKLKIPNTADIKSSDVAEHVKAAAAIIIARTDKTP